MAPAKNNAKSAVSKAQAAAKQNKSTAPANEPTEKPEANDRVAKAQALLHKTCEVTGGKKFKGETVKVYHVGKRPNRWGGIVAMIEHGDGKTAEQGFVDTKYLKAVGEMSEKDIKRLQALREAETSETLYIAATIDVVREKAVRMNYPGWFAAIWFAKDMVVNTGCTMDDDNKTQIYEIPAWKVRSSAGADALEALKGKQEALAAIVEA